MTRRAGPTRGFVLVNALVLVAAMAAAAALLLSRAESGRMRLAAAQEADALTAALDAYQALGQAVLTRDQRSGNTDTLQEAWADPGTDASLDPFGVRLSGQITDAQARYNINWLSVPEDPVARPAFDRLLARLGVSRQAGDVLAAFVSAQGPENRGAYAATTPPTAPLGGPVLMLDQLATIPDLRPEDLSLLRPYLTALPEAAPLNVNTAPLGTLIAMLPQASAGRLATALRARDRDPFPSVEAFFAAVGLPFESDDPEAADPGRFAVASDWFMAETTARLETETGPRQATRQMLFRRLGTGAGVEVAWRVSRFD